MPSFASDDDLKVSKISKDLAEIVLDKSFVDLVYHPTLSLGESGSGERHLQFTLLLFTPHYFGCRLLGGGNFPRLLGRRICDLLTLENGFSICCF